MLRPITAPPPETIATLSDLLAVVLNAEASAKTVAEMREASDAYQKAKAEYETAIVDSINARNAAEAAEKKALPAIEKQAAQKEALVAERVAIAKGKSELESGWANLNTQLEALAADRATFDNVRNAYEAGIADRVAQADAKIAEAEAMRARIEAKLAMLKE